jgi:hypothetical protein
MVTDVRPHCLNAELLILVTESGIVTDVRPAHPWNVPIPILVTESGIATDVRLVHPLNH